MKSIKSGFGAFMVDNSLELSEQIPGFQIHDLGKSLMAALK